MNNQQFLSAKKTSLIFLYVSTFIFWGVISCSDENNVNFSAWSTYTPSPSPTATCIPVILSTPVGWSNVSRLTVILFDAESINDFGYLELANGQKITDTTSFINELIPKIVRPGDQVSIFKLGYRSYESARYSRLYSYIDTPQIYDTPAPFATNPPLKMPTLISTPLDLQVLPATKSAEATMTAYSVTSTAIVQANNCIFEGASQDVNETATAWAKTEVVEISNIQTNSEGVATLMASQITETPYSKSVVFDGLAHASLDIQSDCSSYDICTLIIIDDLSTWTETHQGKMDINLRGVDLVYSIIPNCRDINQPSCKKLEDFWSSVFAKYDIEKIVFTNGVRAESQLLETVGR